MNLELIRLLFDFGLIVLIWLVQLVVYPGFLFYSKESLLKWHQKYTGGIAAVVIPLMFGQLVCAMIQLLETQTLFNILSVILIALVWAITFIQFVPIHNQISKGEFDEALLQKLVNRNWLRTFLWSTIFIWSASKFF